MPGWLGDFTSNPRLAGLALCAFVVLVAVAVILWRYLHNRPTLEEIERRRRQSLHRAGKMGDGEIIDVDGDTIVFSYSVAGAGYTASQDLTAVESLLPPDRMSMIGPVSIKFDPRNPANSIVLCEDWSGLRNREPRSRLA